MGRTRVAIDDIPPHLVPAELRDPSGGQTQHAGQKPTTAQAAEGLSAALRQAEDAIRRLNFGIFASVTIEQEEHSPWSRDICFGKTEGRWGLFLGTTHGEHDQGLVMSDLYAASMETRDLAARALPKLVQALIKAHDERIASLQKVTAMVQQFALELPAQAPNIRDFVDASIRRFDEAE